MLHARPVDGRLDRGPPNPRKRRRGRAVRRGVASAAPLSRSVPYAYSLCGAYMCGALAVGMAAMQPTCRSGLQVTRSAPRGVGIGATWRVGKEVWESTSADVGDSTVYKAKQSV